MEAVVMNPSFWQNRKVLVTGHTGFKGSWLCVWLKELGANICGIALPPISEPNMFELLNLTELVSSHLFDINDHDQLARTLGDFGPEVVFHLAAQSLVRPSYSAPVETFATNVLGTVALLDAIRAVRSVKAVVVITSDKCYENREWVRAYREEDRLGGRDPYSASKGCAEIAAQSMQKSFFAPYAQDGHPARIATARAGNVIGGGDWSEDRLVPDIVRGCLVTKAEVRLRDPGAIRPWQHVLEPLKGYLSVAERLVADPQGIDGAWNFGPDLADNRSVLEVTQAIVAALGQGKIIPEGQSKSLHEAHLLRLDCAKAKTMLGWTPMLTFDDAIRLTADWYLAWAQGSVMRDITKKQILAFMGDLSRAHYIYAPDTREKTA